jgi:chromosome partitioning protein
MKVLAIASHKGGAGKTTLAAHLAIAAEAAGAGPVAVIDTDPQGSLADWWNARGDETVAFAHTHPSRLGADLKALEAAGVSLVILDTPPAIGSTIGAAIAAADLTLVPVRPSPHDLRAVGATLDMAERAGKPAMFVVNGAAQRAGITKDAMISLSRAGELAPVTIHHRTAFADSMTDGRTAGEVKRSSPASQEIHRLWAFITEHLAGIESRSTTQPASLTSTNPRRTVTIRGVARVRKTFGQRGQQDRRYAA